MCSLLCVLNLSLNCVMCATCSAEIDWIGAANVSLLYLSHYNTVHPLYLKIFVCTLLIYNDNSNTDCLRLLSMDTLISMSPNSETR